MRKNIKIGILDSGIGGMSVLDKLLSQETGDIIYIGDNINAPYGNKSKAELLIYIERLLIFLLSKDVDIFINACNSLSTINIQNILQKLNINNSKYMDMANSIENNISNFCIKNKKIMIYGTKATIESGVYQEILSKDYNISTLHSIYLALAIENKDTILINKEIAILIESIIENKPDYLLLACTHYPLVIDNILIAIRENNISNIEIIDPADFITLDLQNKMNDIYKNNKDKNIEIFMTKEIDNKDVLNKVLNNVECKLIITEL